MNAGISANTQAILLLTSGLGGPRSEATTDPLTPGEYKQLARDLRALSRKPADLLGPDANALVRELRVSDCGRLDRLLARGFLMAQAIERWNGRAIWVLSRADPEYPQRLKDRLKEDAPALLFGCGGVSILGTGGLAVVGSRAAEASVLAFAADAGRLAAEARCTVVSGGARGVDQAAMRSALGAAGLSVGVLADSLEGAAIQRENRTPLLDCRLALVSPFDPSAGFTVGRAMQRNKLIYALADAALVVSSDFQKGGTWAGAIEQLKKYRFIPIFVRSSGDLGPGLHGLTDNGALLWPQGPRATELLATLSGTCGNPVEAIAADSRSQSEGREGESDLRKVASSRIGVAPAFEAAADRNSHLDLERISLQACDLAEPKTVDQVAQALGWPKARTRKALERHVKEGLLERTKTAKQVRYRAADSQDPQASLPF